MAVFHAVLALIADDITLVVAHKVQVLLVAGVVVFLGDPAACFGIVHQNLCLAGEGLLDVDLLALAQVDIVLAALKGHLLQSHFGAAEVAHIDAVFDAFDRAADELDIAVIAGSINDNAVRIRIGDRAAGHAQTAAIVNSAFRTRSEGAAVDFYKAPVIDAAGTLRFKFTFRCSTFIDCQAGSTENKAAFTADALEITTVDDCSAVRKFEHRSCRVCCNIVQRYGSTRFTIKSGSVICRGAVCIFASVHGCNTRTTNVNGVAVRLHLCIIYSKCSCVHHDYIEAC